MEYSLANIILHYSLKGGICIVLTHSSLGDAGAALSFGVRLVKPVNHFLLLGGLGAGPALPRRHVALRRRRLE